MGRAYTTSSSNMAFEQRGNTLLLATSDVSARIAVAAETVQLQVFNDSSSALFLVFGDATVVASALGTPIAAGAIVGVTVPQTFTHVAAILKDAAATGNVYLTPGAGFINGSGGSSTSGGGGGAGDASASNQVSQINLATTANGLLGALTETAPATDTASSGLNGRLQRIAQRITSLIALLPASIGTKNAAGSVSVTTASDDALVTLTGALTETAPATDTASSGLNGRLQRIAQRITSLIALLPASLGQKAMAASLAVTIASDQSNVPVNVAAGGVASGTAGTPSADVITVQGPTSNRWSYAAAAGGIVASGSPVTAKAAAGGSVRNYISSIQVINSHPTVGTEIEVRDGAAGTVLHRGWAQPAGGGYAAKFDPPLQGSANTLVQVAEVTTTATTGVLVNLQGFTGT